MLSAALLLAVVIVLAAGLVAGLTGFGFVLVSAPLLLLLFSPPIVVAVSLLLNLLASLLVVLDGWRVVQGRTVLGLLPGAALGLVVGGWLLRVLDAAAIKLIAGLAVMAFALLVLGGWRLPGARSRWATTVSGVLSGALTPTTGLSGPPIVLLFTARALPPHPFRATIAGYFVVVDVLGLVPVLTGSGITRAGMGLAGLLTPTALVGMLLGRQALRHVSPDRFRRGVLVLLVLTGCIAGVSALVTLAGVR